MSSRSYTVDHLPQCSPWVAYACDMGESLLSVESCPGLTCLRGLSSVTESATQDHVPVLDLLEEDKKGRGEECAEGRAEPCSCVSVVLWTWEWWGGRERTVDPVVVRETLYAGGTECPGGTALSAA